MKLHDNAGVNAILWVLVAAFLVLMLWWSYELHVEIAAEGYRRAMEGR